MPPPSRLLDGVASDPPLAGGHVHGGGVGGELDALQLAGLARGPGRADEPAVGVVVVGRRATRRELLAVEPAAAVVAEPAGLARRVGDRRRACRRRSGRASCAARPARRSPSARRPRRARSASCGRRRPRRAGAAPPRRSRTRAASLRSARRPCAGGGPRRRRPTPRRRPRTRSTSRPAPASGERRLEPAHARGVPSVNSSMPAPSTTRWSASRAARSGRPRSRARSASSGHGTCAPKPIARTTIAVGADADDAPRGSSPTRSTRRSRRRCRRARRRGRTGSPIRAARRSTSSL